MFHISLFLIVLRLSQVSLMLRLQVPRIMKPVFLSAIYVPFGKADSNAIGKMRRIIATSLHYRRIEGFSLSWH